MVPPCFAPALMSLRASAHTGVAISIEKRGASRRFNGRTRGCLPIDTPAPRPCSADPDLPHHTNRGSLKGFACLLFSSQLLSTIHGHYSLKGLCLSTFKMCNKNTLPFGEGGRAQRGRERWQIIVPAHLFRLAFGEPPSPEGKAWILLTLTQRHRCRADSRFPSGRSAGHGCRAR